MYSLPTFFKTQPIIIGAILPAILGCLTIIPVYVVATSLFNRKVAAVSAFLIAIIPGEFLNRTQLGNADHHAWEIFLTTLILMCLILIFKTKERNVFKILRENYFTGIALFGLTVIYLASWLGGTLLIGILLLSIGSILFIKVPFLRPALIGAAGIVLGLILTHKIMIPDVFSWQSNISISEVQPLLFTNGNADLSGLWGNFGIISYAGLFGLGIIAYKIKTQKRAIDIVYVVWYVVMLALALAQRRYAYYLAPVLVISGAYVLYLAYSYLKKYYTDKFKFRIVLILCVASIFGSLSFQAVNSTLNDSNLLSSDQLEALAWIKNNEDTPKGVFCTWDNGYYLNYYNAPVMVIPGDSRSPENDLNLLLWNSPDIAFVHDKLESNNIIFVYTTKESADRETNGDSFQYRSFYSNLAGFKTVFENSEVRILTVESISQ